jgi:hypothetical protein
MKKISFNLPPLVERQAHAREAPRCAPCVLTTAPSAPASFTFTLGRVGAVGAGAVLGGVARVTPAPVSAAALRLQKQLLPDPAPEDPCEYRDQYSVGDPQHPKKGCSRFCELVHGVAFSNDVSKRVGTISSLLGPTGHYERLSFWTHFAGAFVFAAYATVRQVLVRDDARVAGGLTSAAAWTIAVVFLTSSLYHCTAPDLNFAMVTRVLDYAAIYIGITVTTTADIAVATRGFVHVPAQTIVDLPASAVILIVFFVWRRSRLPGESTWTKHEITSRSKDGCLLGRGLFSYGHRDLAHIQMRQSTSLLLFGSYFMVVPAAMEVLGHGVARVVLALQICAFVTVALGMAIDRVFEFPDGNLVEGSMTCLACPNTFGAVLNSHALWHLIAMVSAGLTVASREYALAYS